MPAVFAHLDAAQALEAWLKQYAADAELSDQLPKLRVAVREWRVAHEKLAAMVGAARLLRGG